VRVNFTLEETEISRWWPNGYGEQKLYNLSLTFQPKDSEEKTSKIVRVAFRYDNVTVNKR
jgi:hypothetical protein